MRFTSLLLLGVLAAGCAPPKPVPIYAGEPCWRCRQPIKNTRLSGELIAPNGLVSKFRTIHCMSTWIAQQKGESSGQFFVADYSTGKWVRAERASYVRTIVNRDTMARDFLAFADEDTAAATARAEQSRVESWQQVLELGRTAPLGGN